MNKMTIVTVTVLCVCFGQPEKVYSQYKYGCPWQKHEIVSSKQQEDTIAICDFIFPKEGILNTNIDKYKIYQTFDEAKMKGVGKAKENPFVFVFQRNDTALVRLSTDTTSVIMYVKHDSIIISHQELRATGDDYMVKTPKHLPPRMYDRWILNDTIIELRTDFFGKYIHKSLYVKYPNVIYSVPSIENVPNTDDMIALRSYLIRVFMDSLKRKANVYNISDDKNSYFVKNKNGEIREFKKNSLGKLMLQPGKEIVDRNLDYLYDNVLF